MTYAFIGDTRWYWRVPARDLTPEEYAQATEGLNEEELVLVTTLYTQPDAEPTPEPEPEPSPEPEQDPEPEPDPIDPEEPEPEE